MEVSWIWAIIALMMKAGRTSDTPVHHETTRHDIPKGYHVHSRRHENLKSQMSWIYLGRNRVQWLTVVNPTRTFEFHVRR
jgi:hypothetical protein